MIDGSFFGSQMVVETKDLIVVDPFYSVSVVPPLLIESFGPLCRTP